MPAQLPGEACCVPWQRCARWLGHQHSAAALPADMGLAVPPETLPWHVPSCNRRSEHVRLALFESSIGVMVSSVHEDITLLCLLPDCYLTAQSSTAEQLVVQ